MSRIRWMLLAMKPPSGGGTTILSEGFEDITTLVPNGWSRQNLSDGTPSTNWFQGSAGDLLAPAQSGTNFSYIVANYQNTSGANTISNWLLTPTLLLQNGVILTFYTRTEASEPFPDRLQVRMSLNGSSTNVGATSTSVGDFTTLLLDINPTYAPTGYPQSWTLETITLSGIGSPTNGRLAFRYFVENGGPSGANSDIIGIDTVLVTTP